MHSDFKFPRELLLISPSKSTNFASQSTSILPHLGFCNTLLLLPPKILKTSYLSKDCRSVGEGLPVTDTRVYKSLGLTACTTHTSKETAGEMILLVATRMCVQYPEPT